MKQYYIYLTTNLLNNKKYIGKQYGELDDSYLGSGTVFLRAVQKDGKENFIKQILYISKDNEENNQQEKFYIQQYHALEREDFYNIAPGGDGGDIFHSLPQSQQEKLIKKSFRAIKWRRQSHVWKAPFSASKRKNLNPEKEK